MSEIKPNVIATFKYIYLFIFFLLLAGLFHPLITNQGADKVVAGTLTLIIGLAGMILVCKAIFSNKNHATYFGVGFGLVALSLFIILVLTERLPI